MQFKNNLTPPLSNTSNAHHGRALLVALAIGVFTVFTPAAAQDLSNSGDLVESPLSMSLNTQTRVLDNNQSIISVGQFGLNNITNIMQSGDASNSSNVIQAGNNNHSNITQYGAGNIVNLFQAKNNNSFEIIQDGFDNVANVNQLGEQSFTVHQIGNEMVINITQYQQ